MRSRITLSKPSTHKLYTALVPPRLMDQLSTPDEMLSAGGEERMHDTEIGSRVITRRQRSSFAAHSPLLSTVVVVTHE